MAAEITDVNTSEEQEMKKKIEPSEGSRYMSAQQLYLDLIEQVNALKDEKKVDTVPVTEKVADIEEMDVEGKVTAKEIAAKLNEIIKALKS